MSRPKTASSPTRIVRTQTITTTKMTAFSELMMEKRDNADLHMDLKRSQATEENLKNLLMGLNVKMTAYVDQKQDLKQNQSMLA
jgi:hypothetical protein